MTTNDDKTITYVSGNKLDKDAFSELVLKARGDHRSLTEFAKECGVATSTLTRIVNRENTRASSIELLQSIAQNAEEGSKVTFEQLLGANGYVAVEVKMRAKGDKSSSIMNMAKKGIQSFFNALRLEDDEDAFEYDYNYDWDKMNDSEKEAYYSKTVKDIQKEDKYLIAPYREVVLNEILLKGYSISRVTTKMKYFETVKEISAIDFYLESNVLPEGIESWGFHIRPIEEEDVMQEVYQIFYRLYLMQPGKQNGKYTILVNNRRVYDELCDMLTFDHFKFRDPISIMLIDLESRRVVEEFIPSMEKESWEKSIFTEEGKA